MLFVWPQIWLFEMYVLLEQRILRTLLTDKCRWSVNFILRYEAFDATRPLVNHYA